MYETSTSLLDSLRQRADDSSWKRFLDLYGPFIRGWLARHAAMPQDADDLVQDILAVVVRRLPEFERQPRTGAFRRWLLNITLNCLRQYRRTRRSKPPAPGGSTFAEVIRKLEDPASGLSRIWDAEHDQYITRRLLEQIRHNFEPKTWQAFCRVAIEGQPPAEVAQELGVTINAVFIAKSRVLTLLRQAGEGLVE